MTIRVRAGQSEVESRATTGHTHFTRQRRSARQAHLLSPVAVVEQDGRHTIGELSVDQYQVTFHVGQFPSIGKLALAGEFSEIGEVDGFRFR